MRSPKIVAPGFAIFAALGLLATGCSSGTGTSPSPSEAAPNAVVSPDASSTAAPERGSADLVIWASQGAANALKPFADKFGQDNGISVEVQGIAGELRAAYVTATNSGKGPDVLLTATDAIGNLVQNAAIEPLNLSPETKSKFVDVTVESVTANGQIYGVPSAVDNVALIRNTDLVPELPATFDDVVKTGLALKEQGKVSEALSLPVGQNGDSYHLQPLFTSAGGYLFGQNADGTYNQDDLGLDKPESIAAMTKIQEFAKAGVLKTSISGDNSIPLFAEGKSPFLVSGGWALEDLNKSGVKYAVSPVPGIGGNTAKPFVGTQAFFVSSKAKNKTFAEEFTTNYMANNPDIAVALSKADGRAPALNAAFQELAASDPVLKGFGDSAAQGQPSPTFPAMAVAWDPFSKAEAAIIGGADPASTLKAAADTIRQQIKAAG